jgi:Predicted membrane protein
MSQSFGTAQAVDFRFSGKGGEYFRIWIVNLALTILTLGIYSAWAKVRRLQYFYRNTSLAGSSFDYHGDPVAILKGRILAVVLLVLYNVAGSANPALGMAVFAMLMLAFPWLAQRSLRFKLHNSSYRGLRFGFDGMVGGAYKVFLLWPAIGYLTLGLLMPVAHQRVKSYQHGSSRYGAGRFGFLAREGGFFGIYFKMLGMLILLGIIAAVLAGGAMSTSALLNLGAAAQEQQQALAGLVVFAMLAFYLAAFLVLGPWFSARIQNLVWNGTTLGEHAFHSRVRARELFVIYLTNFIGIVLTLGLFKPFADVRLARYRLEHMGLNAQGHLDEFMAGRQRGVSATGEEAAEIFDFDISF